MYPRAFDPSKMDVSPPSYSESTSSSATESKSLTKLNTVPPEISAEAKALYHEIKAAGLENHEARVCMALDISISMQHKDHNQFFFGEDGSLATGKIQRLINKSVALALLFDNDGIVEIHPFAGTVYPPVLINRDNFTHAAELVWKATGGVQESTNYAEPVKAIRSRYFKDNDAERKTSLSSVEAPVFTLFVTDGEPTVDKTGARNQFKWASYMPIFFKFLALRGNQHDAEFSFLKDIDDSKTKNENFIDNADLVILNQPEDLTMQQLIHEYRGWALEAGAKKLIADPKIRSAIGIHSEGRITSSTPSTSSVATTPGTTFAPVVPTPPTSTPTIAAKVDPACCRIL